MQTQHEAFLSSIDWDGYHGQDANAVDGEDRDVDEMLDVLSTISEDRLDEYEENQHFTSPSRERREARQRAEYRIQQKKTNHSPISGTH